MKTKCAVCLEDGSMITGGTRIVDDHSVTVIVKGDIESILAAESINNMAIIDDELLIVGKTDKCGYMAKCDPNTLEVLAVMGDNSASHIVDVSKYLLNNDTNYLIVAEVLDGVEDAKSSSVIVIVDKDMNMVHNVKITSDMIAENSKNPMIFKSASTDDGIVFGVGVVESENIVRGLLVKLDIKNSTVASIELSNPDSDYSALHSIKLVNDNFEVGMITRHKEGELYSNFFAIDTDFNILDNDVQQSNA
jgi:hypothetical protein